jgi:hypothetical protein
VSIRTKLDDRSYLIIDNGDGPGMPDEIMVSLGFQPGSGRGKQEFNTYTCNHCEQVFLENPWRARERGWCRFCDKYLCDPCQARLTATGVCKPFKRLLEEIQVAADKGRPVQSVEGSIILLS